MMDVVIRQATPDDTAICGLICYEAFSKINAEHGFPCDFPGPEAAIGLLSRIFCQPGVYCVVAESKGRVVGSNCLDERSTIAGVGPITVSPETQNSGIGRKLMEAIIARAKEKRAARARCSFPNPRVAPAAPRSRECSARSGVPARRKETREHRSRASRKAKESDYETPPAPAVFPRRAFRSRDRLSPPSTCVRCPNFASPDSP